MAKREVAELDFETDKIETRPKYPPEPLGVAIRAPGVKAQYLSWGHDTGNNCDKSQAAVILRDLWKSKARIAMHHGKFDQCVAHEHFGLPYLPPERLDDTMFLSYLVDPYSYNFGLKPQVAKHLGIPATERDELKDWIVANVKEAKKSNWFEFMRAAPGDLVGKYAGSDILMTAKLRDHLKPKLDKLELVAYERELKLTPILLLNEKQGVKLDMPLLEKDVATYDGIMVKIDAWLGKRLKCKNIHFTNKTDKDGTICLPNALERAGKIKAWVLTEKGERSMAAEALEVMVDDKELLSVLKYRAVLVTCLNTFMRNWLNQGREYDGWTYSEWKQTRDEHDTGAASGRMSSSPNKQNIPTNDNLERLERNLPSWLPPLPRVRRYIIPDAPGQVIMGRDFSSQEPRILAHFEGGKLCAAYNADEWLDPHAFVAAALLPLRPETTRGEGKTINLAKIYGQGLKATAAKLGITYNAAKQLDQAYIQEFPGVKELHDGMKELAATNQALRTIGGRKYYCEAPRILQSGPRKGRLATFEYKMVNYLCQGSAGDMTKESIINYHEHPKRRGRWMFQVHDENRASVAKKLMMAEQAVMMDCMDNAFKLDVPIRSEGSWGLNFHELTELPRGQ